MAQSFVKATRARNTHADKKGNWNDFNNLQYSEVKNKLID